MNKKKTFLLILVAVILVVALLGVYFASRAPFIAGRKAFTVVVVHSDGQEKTLTYRSAEQYLGTVLEKDGLIEGEPGDFGMYIMKVDGEKAVYEEDNAYWSFYEGDAYANQGIDLTPIQDGAVYKLVYTPADEY